MAVSIKKNIQNGVARKSIRDDQTNQYFAIEVERLAQLSCHYEILQKADQFKMEAFSYEIRDTDERQDVYARRKSFADALLPSTKKTTKMISQPPVYMVRKVWTCGTEDPNLTKGSTQAGAENDNADMVKELEERKKHPNKRIEEFESQVKKLQSQMDHSREQQTDICKQSCL